jgi:NAD-dependent dihydropyrimidine dehydrogenase PreA subunit
MASCCGTTNACCAPAKTETSCSSGGNEGFVSVSTLNTLAFNAGLCINCGMCSAVCPHGVFVPGVAKSGRAVVAIVRADACMECGACEVNCPTRAIAVDSGVGCAAAMIHAALTGAAEPTCG